MSNNTNPSKNMVAPGGVKPASKSFKAICAIVTLRGHYELAPVGRVERP